MDELAARRESLAADLAQVEETLALLHDGPGSPWESDNATVRALAEDAVNIKQEMLALTERELRMLQDQIQAAREAAEGRPSDPQLETGTDLDREAAAVRRLQTLIATYYEDLRRLAETMPSEEELAQRRAALAAAQAVRDLHIDPDKVLLDGTEGSVVLRNMTERLSDEDIPESRRDIAPICSIRTRLFGNLVASENRSLRPVGKNQYVARVRLQPGTTSLRLRSGEWRLKLPDDANAADFLVTLTELPGADAELHVFPVDGLLAADNAYIPAWLPPELNLAPTT